MKEEEMSALFPASQSVANSSEKNQVEQTKTSFLSQIQLLILAFNNQHSLVDSADRFDLAQFTDWRFHSPYRLM